LGNSGLGDNNGMLSPDWSPFRASMRDVPAKRVVEDWEGGLRLDRGEHPFPPSPKVIEAVSRWARQANRYPDPGYPELRRKLARYAGCEPGQIAIGNGSDELIDTIARCCLDAGDEVLIPALTFDHYERAARIACGTVRSAPMDSAFGVDTSAILAGITPRTKVIFVANPNNPTGHLVAPSSLIALVEKSPCLVVIDECYFEFSGATLAEYVADYKNLLILRSFSKCFSLAGLRLGYCIAREELAGTIHSALQPFPVSGAAQAAGLAALNDLDYARSRIAELVAERQRVARELGSLGFRTHKSVTNFLFVDASAFGLTAREIAVSLREQAVHVHDCTDISGTDHHHFRISLGDRAQNDRLLRNLTALRDRSS